MSRFDKPTPPDVLSQQALSRIESTLSALVDAMAALEVNPQVNVAPAAAPEVVVPTEGFVEALSRVQGQLAEIADEVTREREAPPMNLEAPHVEVNVAEYLDQQERVRMAIEAMTEKISNVIQSNRSHFDGRLRNEQGVINDSNPMPTYLASPPGEGEAARSVVEDLSFTTTLAPLGTYQTAWTDLRDYSWLDIVSNIEGADAVHALIEFTNAPNPTASPPTADDVVRPLNATLAGDALGGVDIPSFGIPAQMRWGRITLTDLTGGQDISVSTYGHVNTPDNALLPLSTPITKDFRAAVTKALTVGENPQGDYVDVPVDGDIFTALSYNGAGPLPSGPAPTYDPVNPIVAPNVYDTGWVELSRWNYQSFRSQFDIPGVKIYLIDAANDQGQNSITNDLSVPTAVSPAFGSTIISAPLFQNYFRVIICNDTGSTANLWGFRSHVSAYEPGPLFLSIDQTLQDFFPAPVQRAVLTGRDPNGTYRNVQVSEEGTLVIAPGQRISQVLGRSHVDASKSVAGAATAVNSNIYTVPAGKRFQMTSIEVTLTNDLSGGVIRVTDDTGTGAGTAKRHYAVAPGTNQTKAAAVTTATFPEPIPFTSGVTLAVPAIGIGNNATCSIVGYIEDI